MEHDLTGRQFQRNSQTFVDARHGVASRFQTLVLPQTVMMSGQYPHTAVVHRSCVEGQPAGHDGSVGTDTEIVVVLVPEHLTTCVGWFVETLTEDHLEVWPDQAFDDVEKL